MAAAENLHRKMWGQNLSAVLDEVLDHDGVAWKYVRKGQLDLLEMDKFGYTEKALLVRAEYEVALKELHLKKERHDRCRGAVVIGQPGIGRSLHWIWHLAKICWARKNMLSLLSPALSTRPKGSCGLSINWVYHCISRWQCL